MKKLHGRKSTVKAVLVSLAAASLFYSCEVGLGSAVDVEPPAIEILTPETSSVIRDSFAIAGKWSDDGEIADIKVSLKNTGSGKVLPDAEGIIEQEADTKEFRGTWKAVIKPVEDKITDGSYEATVTIKDKGGHKTVATRSFTIDNTPPVVVLQRPSTKYDSESPDTQADVFGQTLSLSGQAADDNNIAVITVRIFSDPEMKNEIHHVNLYNVPPTISLDVANFEEGENNDYAKIYGSTAKEGRKPEVYCSITAYDDAKRIPLSEEDAREDDASGNSSDVYYLYDEIYDNVLSKYRVTQLYSIMNGTFEDDDAGRSAQAQNVPALLQANQIKTGKFALNPANNPVYKVIGREGLKNDGTDFNTTQNDLTNESRITVKADVGLDSIPIKKETLKIYLLPFGQDGKTAEDKAENRIYPVETGEPEKAGSGYNLTARISKDGNVDKDGKSVTISVGKSYQIKMEGKDSSGNEIVADEDLIFGFRLASNAAAPLADIKTYVNLKADGTFQNEGKESDSMIYVPRYKPDVSPAEESTVRFSGTINVEDGEPEVRLTIDGGENIAVTDLVEVSGKKGEFTFTKDIAVSSLENPDKSGQHNIVFYISQADTTKITKSIMYQVEAPKVTISRTEPVAYKYLNEEGTKESEEGSGDIKKFLNGKNVRLNVTVIAGAVGLDESDEGKPVIQFIQEGRPTVTMASPTFGETDSIDTTQFEEGKLTVRITARDMAGNKTVCEETYYVDQDTDEPVILPKNAANSTFTFTQVSDAEDLSNTTRNVYSANQTVSYKLIDDDGIACASYKIYKKDQGEGEEPFASDTISTINGATDYQLEVTMPAEPNTYKVVLYVQDVNTQNQSSPSCTGTAAKENTKTFYVRVTAAAPTIESIRLTKTNLKAGDSISPVIKIKSDQVPFELTRVIKDESDIVIESYTTVYTKDSTGMSALNSASPSVTDGITVTKDDSHIKHSGQYYITYTVKDRNDKKGEATTSVTVDLTAPKITEVSVAGNEYDAAVWNNSKTLSLSITAADTAGETGIDAVEYSVNGSIWTALSNESGDIYSGSAVFTTEGAENALYIRAKDIAGNITYFDGETSGGIQENKSVNVKIDTSAPVLTADKYKIGDLSAKDIDSSKIYVKSGTNLTISGSYKDVQSGTEALKLYKVTENQETGETTETFIADPQTGSDGKWSVTYTAGEANRGKLLLKGKNKAGIDASVSPFEVDIDSKNPEIKNISLKTDASNSYVYKKSETVYYVNNTKKFTKDGAEKTPEFTVAGIATDDKGVDTVELYIDGVKKESQSISDFSFAGLDWKDKTGSIKIKIKAVDIAGNFSESDEITVNFDTQNPASVHEIDDSQKDLTFRIGDSSNDKTTGAGEADKDVGGKYFNGTYGSALTMLLRGNFPDNENGSGISKYYYLVSDREIEVNPEKATGNTAVAGSGADAGKLFFNSEEILKKYVTDSDKKGSFQGTDSELKRVEFNVKKTSENTEKKRLDKIISDGQSDPSKNPEHIEFVKEKAADENGIVYYQYRKDVYSTYKSNIKGFSEGKNYLVIVAEDNVGNTGVDSAEVGSNTYYCYSLNVDVTAPSIPKKHEEGVFTNVVKKLDANDPEPDATVMINGTVSDKPKAANGSSGIKEIVFTGDQNDEKVTLRASSLTAATAAEIEEAGDSTLKKWSVDVRPLLSKAGTAVISAMVTDNAGYSTSVPVATVTVDKTAPSVTITSPSNGGAEGKTFTVSGTAGDGNGAGLSDDKMILYYTASEPAKETDGSYKKPSSASGWTAVDTNITADSEWTKSVDVSGIAADTQNTALYFTASAKDKAGSGNTGFAVPVKVIIDRKLPDYDSTKTQIGGKGHADVSTAWFKDETLVVKGKFTDDGGSGVETILYKVVPEGQDAAGIAYEELPTKDGSFNTNITFPQNSESTLIINARDKAGNETTGTQISYTVKTDKSLPEISETGEEGFAFNRRILTNAEEAKTFKFYVSDSGSGIASAADVEVEAGSKIVPGTGETDSKITLGNKTAGTNGEKDKWLVTVILGTKDLKELDGSNSVLVTVKDAALNKSNSQSIGTLNVDKDKPEPVFTSHTSSSVINKTVTVSGSVTDDSSSAITAITLTAENGSGTTKKTKTYVWPAQAGKETITWSKGQWSADIDTTYFNDEADLSLSLTATDEAGNTTSPAVKITPKISQDSDRPEIKMNQVAQNIYITSKTVFGSVKDDDGTIENLWVWSKQLKNAEPSAAPSRTSSENDEGEEVWTWTVPAGWIEFGAENTDSTLENNNWQIDSSESDGETTWFWAVADKDHNVFWTKDSDELKRPYITYKDAENKADNTAGIAFKYDTTSPEINSVDLLRLSSTVTTAAGQIEAYMASQNPPLQWSALNGMVFGGKQGKLYMKVTVTEQTGMADTPLTIKKGNASYLTVTAGTSGNMSVTDENNVYTYILGPFDMTAKDSENVTLMITATDKAGKTGTKEKTITVDNTADIKVSRVTPKPDTETSGEFAFQGSVEDSLSSIASVEYYIPPYGKAVADVADTDWKSVTDASALSWKIEFSGNDNNFSKILGYTTGAGGTQATVSEDFAGYDTGTASDPSGVYHVPLWLRVKDEVGNTACITQTTDTDKNNVVSHSDLKVKYNPNADRPSVVIIDPEITQDGVEKGGNFRISGTATDNEGISAVYLQFDFGNGNFDNGSLSSSAENIPNTKDSNNNPLKGIKATGTRNWNYKLDVSAIPNYTSSSKFVRVRAIAVDSDEVSLTSAWSDILKVKVNNEIPYFEDLWLRQRADKNSAADPEGTVLVEREFSQDMFIKDTANASWFLEGKAATASSEYISGLSALTYSWTGNGTTLSANPSGAHAEYVTENGHTNILFRIPVNGTSVCQITVSAEDAKDPKGESSAPYTINIDNTPPSFPDLYKIADEAAGQEEGIRLYRDAYGSVFMLGEENRLQNSNGTSFTLAGKIIESGSGFEKAAFYIKRTGNDGKVRIYNPLKAHGEDNMANRTDIVSAADSTAPLTINTDNLPVRTLTVTKSAAGDILESDVIKTDKDTQNIHIGGLVYIGGLYRSITGVDYTNGKVTINPPYSGSENSAQFVYALIIDHQGEAEADNGILGDDGDGLLESFSGSTSKNFSWEASFNSANIPDGPVEIHVVAFDQAGNIGHGYTKTIASNNAPRITKLMLGTDLNGNGRFDFGSGEFSTFYAQTDDNNNPITKSGVKKWDLDTKDSMGKDSEGNQLYWKLRNGAALIPEFVGGTPDYYYTVSKGTAGISEPAKLASTKTGITSSVLAAHKLKKSGENNAITLSGTSNPASWSYSQDTNTGGSLVLTNNDIDATGSTEDQEIVLRFTFWDSTEDSLQGWDTGYSILNLKLMQDLSDGKNPEAEIEPFIWKGTGYNKKKTVTVNGEVQKDQAFDDVVETLEEEDKLGTNVTTAVDNTTGDVTVTTAVITPKNSLYGASRDNGHIELESDLNDDIKGLYGNDPKVSGKITFHGTAYDDTRLSSIWFKFDEFTASNGKSSSDSAPASGYTQAAWYNPGSALWENATARMEDVKNEDGEVTTASSHWEFTASDSSFDQNGHYVDWYLSIDTAYISNTVGLDKALSVIVLDAASTHNKSAASAYSMDVVPYVSSLTTSLSGFQSSNPSVYDRTALGHYPVYMTHAQGNGDYTFETVKINGFNIDSDTTVVFAGGSAENPVTDSIKKYTYEKETNGNYKEAAAGATDFFYGFKVSNSASVESGKISVQKTPTGTTTAIKSLNNLNNNDAKGSVTGSTITQAGGYSGCYNRQPNGINNNILTDDLEIDIWDFNSEAAVSQNNSCLDIMMEINPFNGLIGFAFADGYRKWCMPKKDTSYTTWATSKDFIQLTGLAYDAKGNAYGTAAGGESSGSGQADAYNFYTSRWGPSAATGKGDNALRIECTGETKDGSYTLNKTRFQSPSFATLSLEDENSVNVTNIYLAFFDSTNGEIRFRAGTLKQNSKTNNGTFGSFYDSYTNKDDGATPKNYGDNAPFQIIANKDGEGLGYAGDYVSIGVTSNNVLVIAWYDAQNKNLMFSYNTDPLTIVNSKDNNGISAKTGNFVKIQEPLISDAGKYCHLVVAGDNSIHVAAYDNAKGDLKYVYIPFDSEHNIPDLANKKVCTVDSYLSVGKELTIDVAGEIINGETYYIPHIGYNGNTPKKPRYAYLKEPASFLNATTDAGRSGVNDKDEYTGIWECTLVPTDSDLTEDNNKRRINIGLWKANVTTGTGESAVTVKGQRVSSNYEGFLNGTSYANVGDGKCYGNNTSNAVLGYGVQFNTQRDYVETAQKR